MKNLLRYKKKAGVHVCYKTVSSQTKDLWHNNSMGKSPYLVLKQPSSYNTVAAGQLLASAGLQAELLSL